MKTSRTHALCLWADRAGWAKPAEQLVLEVGGSVVLLERRAEKLEAAAKELRPHGPVDTVVLDVTDGSAVRTFAGRVPEVYADLTGSLPL